MGWPKVDEGAVMSWLERREPSRAALVVGLLAAGVAARTWGRRFLRRIGRRNRIGVAERPRPAPKPLPVPRAKPLPPPLPAPRRERVLALLDRLRMSWRQRCVLETLARFARDDGWFYYGNKWLAIQAGSDGYAIAERRGGKYRERLRFDRTYLCRVLRRLRVYGYVEGRWFLSPRGLWVRSLRVNLRALERCAAVGDSNGCPWDLRRQLADPDVRPPGPRWWGQKAMRLLRRTVLDEQACGRMPRHVHARKPVAGRTWARTYVRTGGNYGPACVALDPPDRERDDWRRLFDGLIPRDPGPMF